MMAWQKHPQAPTPGTRLCTLDEIPNGSGKEFVFGQTKENFSLVVFRQDDSVWGYVNVCPHFWLPLNALPGKFLISGRGRVMCSYHSSIFRFEDGFCTDGPVRGGSLDPVPVEVLDSSVIISEA